MTSAMRTTASMLMPARVEATLTDEHTRLVPLMAAGMASMQRRVAAREPLLHHGAEAADEVDADLLGGGVQGVRHLDVRGRGRRCPPRRRWA